MASSKKITIRQGRTGTITNTVTGIDDWSDLNSTLVVTNKAKEEQFRLTGEIDSINGIITFNYLHSNTSSISAGAYEYEIIIYKVDDSFIKTSTYGIFQIDPVLIIDPTV